uniref:Secreted protein n=1 Tax=Ascaris lumbricoides TaxID=6252 RepID=A0A0M3IUK1_ASCLU
MVRAGGVSSFLIRRVAMLWVGEDALSVLDVRYFIRLQGAFRQFDGPVAGSGPRTSNLTALLAGRGKGRTTGKLIGIVGSFISLYRAPSHRRVASHSSEMVWNNQGVRVWQRVAPTFGTLYKSDMDDSTAFPGCFRYYRGKFTKVQNRLV